MEVSCSTCKGQIKADNINVAKDTAYCTKCESLHVLSSLGSDNKPEAPRFDPYEKVKGVVVPSSRVSVVCKAIDKEKLVDLRIIGFDTTPQNIDFLNLK